MKTIVEHSVVVVFEDIKIAIVEHGKTTAVATWAKISLTEDTEEGPYLDVTVKGYECKSDGTIDKRQKSASYIRGNASQKYKLLLDLLDQVRSTLSYDDYLKIRPFLEKQHSDSLAHEKKMLDRFMERLSP